MRFPCPPGGVRRFRLGWQRVAKAMATRDRITGRCKRPAYQLVSTEPSYFSSMKAFTSAL